jgi:hypothetical protein
MITGEMPVSERELSLDFSSPLSLPGRGRGGT